MTIKFLRKVKYTSLIYSILIISITNNVNYPQTSKINYEPLNPEFENYIKQIRKDQYLLKSLQTNLGSMPEPLLLKPTVNKKTEVSNDLPSKFDLRNYGIITSVKNQFQFPDCWAFTVLGAIESRTKYLSFGEYDLSENHLVNHHGFISKEGGNSSKASSYFLRGSGPLLESEDPFHAPTYSSIKFYYPTFNIVEYCGFAGETNAIKEILFTYGSLYTSFIWDSKYFDYTKYTYYRDVKKWTPGSGYHAVLLIGWDNEIQTPAGSGAWIAKNSWGNNWGDKGYFYISYNDSSLVKAAYFWPKIENYNKKIKIHQYDLLGRTSAIGLNDTTAYALVKFRIPSNQKIIRLGTWLNGMNSSINFEVYKSFDGINLFDKVAETGVIYSEFAGYKTVEITPSLEFLQGTDIFLKVKYVTREGNFPIPIEKFIEGYANPHIETNKCWISPDGNTGSWIEVGNDTDNKFDLCIKAYTTEINNNESNISTLVLNNYPNPFNNSTTIEFNLAENEPFTVEIFDMLGQRIEHFNTSNQSKYLWTPNGSTGIYIVRVTTPYQSQTIKMLFIK